MPIPTVSPPSKKTAQTKHTLTTLGIDPMLLLKIHGLNAKQLRLVALAHRIEGLPPKCKYTECKDIVMDMVKSKQIVDVEVIDRIISEAAEKSRKRSTIAPGETKQRRPVDVIFEPGTRVVWNQIQPNKGTCYAFGTVISVDHDRGLCIQMARKKTMQVIDTKDDTVNEEVAPDWHHGTGSTPPQWFSGGMGRKFKRVLDTRRYTDVYKLNM
jgi:hypothetical protein